MIKTLKFVLCACFICAAVGALAMPPFDTHSSMFGMAQVNDALVRTGSANLNKRLGALYNEPDKYNYAFWARGLGKEMESTVSGDTLSGALYGAQAGLDLRVFKNSDDRFYIGFMGSYIKSSGLETAFDYDVIKNKVDASALAAGLYGTWISEGGWYADITAAEFFTSVENQSYISGWEDDASKKDFAITATTLEIGKSFNIDLSKTSALLITPKVRGFFAYTPAKVLNMNDPIWGDLEYKGSTSLMGSAGVYLAYSKKLAGGGILEPYLEGGYNYEFDAKTEMEFDDIKYTEDLGGGYFDIGGGLNWQIKDWIAFYSYLGYEKGSNIENYGANTGVRLRFGSVAPAALAIPSPKVLGKIESSHFDFGKYSLKPEYDANYKQAAAKIKDYGGKVEIAGHTDLVGTAEYNQTLSEQRAKAVYDKMVQLGIPAEQMQLRGYGFGRPIYDYKGKEANAANRRVEIVELP